MSFKKYLVYFNGQLLINFGKLLLIIINAASYVQQKTMYARGY
jgi:hypothetical protein